ncbi:hypothetical protein V6N13_107404 [Hibiscus sabdariffa]|uniref:Uncharacterized protein n=1 Tax=Hibiscus sabdariffa TaxID=183260 RepID=A0ABR2SP48_9ROSI
MQRHFSLLELVVVSLTSFIAELVLLSPKPGRAHLQAWVPARRVWDCAHMGRCLAVERALLRAQELQPLHMQLLLFCCQLSKPALLQRINELEHDSRGSTADAQGAVGRFHVDSKIILPFCGGVLPWVSTGRVAVRDRSLLDFSPPHHVVSAGDLLCQNLTGKLELSLFSPFYPHQS